MAAKLVPINTSAATPSAISTGRAVTLKADQLPSDPTAIPKTFADLDGVVRSFTSMISWNVAAHLGFTFVNADMSASSQIFVQDFILFKDVESNGQKVRYGVGTRTAVSVTSSSASANVTSVPFIAASTSFGFASASAEFVTPGLVSPKIASLVPLPKSLNLETYLEFQNAAAQIRDLIFDSATSVVPQILWVTVEEPDNTDFEDAMARAWALEQIARGHNIYDSVTKHGDSSPHFKEVVRHVYLEIAGTTSDSQLPDDVAKARAKKLELGFSVSP